MTRCFLSLYCHWVVARVDKSSSLLWVSVYEQSATGQRSTLPSKTTSLGFLADQDRKIWIVFLVPWFSYQSRPIAGQLRGTSSKKGMTDRFHPSLIEHPVQDFWKQRNEALKLRQVKKLTRVICSFFALPFKHDSQSSNTILNNYIPFRFLLVEFNNLLARLPIWLG